MFNPYDNYVENGVEKEVNWDNQLMTCTHDHTRTFNVNDDQEAVDKLIVGFQDGIYRLYQGGIRCFLMSNYRISEPTCTYKEYGKKTWGVDFGDPWYKAISKNSVDEWVLTLDPNMPQEPYIEIPNAEHHNFNFDGTNPAGLHLNPLGATIKKGEPRGGQISGYNQLPLKQFAEEVDANYGSASNPLKGGITINHLYWTTYSGGAAIKGDLSVSGKVPMYTNAPNRIFDLSDQIVGIEVCSGRREGCWPIYTRWQGVTQEGDDPDTHFLFDSSDEEVWDAMLLTGRRVIGFAGPDHTAQSTNNWYSRVMLLLDEPLTFDNCTSDTMRQKCLDCLTQGRSYLKGMNTPLKFTNISVNGETVTATASDIDEDGVNHPCDFTIIKDGIKTVVENVNTVKFSNFSIYARIEVNSKRSLDKLHSQPIIRQEFTRGQKVAKKSYRWY